MTKVLIILKRREGYGEEYATNFSTGLLNSSSFVGDMLRRAGIESKLVIVTDNNDIDREVHHYRPTHAIIEALWVVPEKFEALSRLHPHVCWIVRLHSNLPFLSGEGVAMDWISRYLGGKRVYVAVNSPAALFDIRSLKREGQGKVIYLPNYYPVKAMAPVNRKKRRRVLNVGCFGAIRPLKNHLQQAVAAIRFAESMNIVLHFHVNADRVEMKGDPIVRNLEALFLNTPHKLVKHDWLDHADFLDLVKAMDLSMQVSFSETFNIVAADSVACGIATIVSRQIPWARAGLADPADTESILRALKRAWMFRCVNVFLNQAGLSTYVGRSRKIWLSRLA